MLVIMKGCERMWKDNLRPAMVVEKSLCCLLWWVCHDVLPLPHMIIYVLFVICHVLLHHCVIICPCGQAAVVCVCLCHRAKHTSRKPENRWNYQQTASSCKAYQQGKHVNKQTGTDSCFDTTRSCSSLHANRPIEPSTIAAHAADSNLSQVCMSTIEWWQWYGDGANDGNSNGNSRWVSRTIMTQRTSNYTFSLI